MNGVGANRIRRVFAGPDLITFNWTPSALDRQPVGTSEVQCGVVRLGAVVRLGRGRSPVLDGPLAP
jgi:hypothetical protein